MKKGAVMPRDHQMRENLSQGSESFPIQYYTDNFARWERGHVPLHWHREPEFFSVYQGEVEVQAGDRQFRLTRGESIFLNGNQFHSYTQIGEKQACLCPNIVFSGELMAPVTSRVYQKYLSVILYNPSLPCFILRPSVEWQARIIKKMYRIYGLLAKYGEKGFYEEISLDFEEKERDSPCFELDVAEELMGIFRELYVHRNTLPFQKECKKEQKTQIRLGQMLDYINEHYREKISLEEVAASAGISPSEAGRCFQKYYGKAPVEYVIEYRLNQARRLLESSDLSVKEIGFECGFYDPSYFSRIYRRHFGVTPGNYRRKAGTERQNAGLDLHQGIHYNKFSKKKKEENL